MAGNKTGRGPFGVCISMPYGIQQQQQMLTEQANEICAIVVVMCLLYQSNRLID